jgi:hypothetical protein
LLVVSETVVLVRERGAVEYALRIHKIEPVVLQVSLALNLVPREPRWASVYSLRIYVKRSNWLPSNE